MPGQSHLGPNRAVWVKKHHEIKGCRGIVAWLPLGDRFVTERRVPNRSDCGRPATYIPWPPVRGSRRSLVGTAGPHTYWTPADDAPITALPPGDFLKIGGRSMGDPSRHRQVRRRSPDFPHQQATDEKQTGQSWASTGLIITSTFPEIVARYLNSSGVWVDYKSVSRCFDLRLQLQQTIK